MLVKKVFGYLFILLAIAMTIAVVFQIPKTFNAIAVFFFDGNPDEQYGVVHMEQIGGWLITLGLAVLFWRYGGRWARKA